MDINRKDFIMSIKCDVFKDMINQYFDESMALYDLIGNKISDLDIFVGVDMTSKHSEAAYGMIFSLAANSEVNAVEIKDILDKYSVSCYNHNYSVETVIVDKEVHIKFNEEVSG